MRRLRSGFRDGSLTFPSGVVAARSPPRGIDGILPSGE
jgi:hypothetical protein